MQDPFSPQNDLDGPVVGYEAQSLTRAGVVLTGFFEDSPEITEYGFEMAENSFGEGTGEVFSNPPKDGRGRFSYRTRLSPGHVYSIRSYFTNGVARKYSQTLTLKAPTVSAATVSEVSFSNGSLRAGIIDDGGAEVREVGFCWSESPDPAAIRRNKARAVLEDDGTFSLNLSFFERGRVYHILAYVENASQASGEAVGYSLQPFEIAVTDDLPVDISNPAFARVLLSQFDADRDGRISYNELKRIQVLSFNTDDITDIGEIRLMPALTVLNCTGSAPGRGRLSEVDLGGNPLLRQLSVSGNPLETLDVSPCLDLETLDATSCPQLQTIYLSTGQWYRTESDFTKDAQASFRLHPEAIIPIADAHFRKYLVDRFDQDGDDQISGAEAAAIDRIDICSDEVETLSGIEFFDRLTWLNCCGSHEGLLALGRLIELDVSRNPLEYLDCRYNPCLSTVWLKTGQHIESLSFDGTVTSVQYK